MVMILCDQMGHLISTTDVEELHDFAKEIGLKREWFQGEKRPHYDLTTMNKKRHAIRAGAILVSPKVIAAFFKFGELPLDLL